MELLSTTHAALPEPLPQLTGLASYYLENDHDAAFDTLKYLDHLIHITQQSSDWNSLEAWALCHQREDLLYSVKRALQTAQDPEHVGVC